MERQYMQMRDGKRWRRRQRIVRGVKGVGLILQVESIEGEALANLEEVLMLEVEVGS